MRTRDIGARGTRDADPHTLQPGSEEHSPTTLFGVSAPTAAVGVLARSAQNAQPGACEDTPREPPRPRRSPAYGRPGLGKSQPVWCNGAQETSKHGETWNLPRLCGRKVDLRAPMVTKTP